jgi:hypothetical protein
MLPDAAILWVKSQSALSEVEAQLLKTKSAPAEIIGALLFLL